MGHHFVHSTYTENILYKKPITSRPSRRWATPRVVTRRRFISVVEMRTFPWKKYGGVWVVFSMRRTPGFGWPGPGFLGISHPETKPGDGRDRPWKGANMGFGIWNQPWDIWGDLKIGFLARKWLFYWERWCVFFFSCLHPIFAETLGVNPVFLLGVCL